MKILRKLLGHDLTDEGDPVEPDKSVDEYEQELARHKAARESNRAERAKLRTKTETMQAVEASSA